MKSIAMTAAVAALTAVAAPASAEIRFADMVEAIRLGGNERMMVFALSDGGLPADAREARNRMLTGMGVGGEPGTITRRNLSFSPVLTHDSNINGGYGSSSFTFGGLPFTIEDQYQSVGGLLIGGGVNGNIRMAMGGRTALSLSANGSIAYAPEHDMWKTSVGASACVNHFLSAATWAYGCLDVNYRKIELGENTRYSLRTGVNHNFFSDFGIHELTAELQHIHHDGATDYDQMVGTISVTSALSGGYAVTLGAQIGEEVEGVNVMRERVFGGVAFDLFDRPTSVTVGIQNNSGGMFLGNEVDNRIYSIGLSHQVTDKLGVSIYASETHSSEAFYDDSQFGLNVSWRF